MKPTPRTSLRPYLLPALAGVGLVIVLAGAVAMVAGSRRSAGDRPEATVAAVSKAIRAGDIDAAMARIDFDAIFEDVWRTNTAMAAGVKLDDPLVEESLTTPMARQARSTFKGNLVHSLKDTARPTPEKDTLISALTSLDGLPVVTTSSDKAYVALPNDRRLLLAKTSEKGWMIVGYGGYEKDFATYKEGARNMMLPEQKDQAAPTPAP